MFRGLTVADIRAVIEAARTRKAPAGSFFFQQEDPAEHAYLLARGQVKLGQVTPDGQQVILNVIGPWTVFGLVAITPNARYPASAQAVTDCQAFSWDQATLSRLIALYPKLAVNAMGIMAARVNEFQGQIRTLATERVERRLARVLLRLAREVGRKVEEGVLIDLSRLPPGPGRDERDDPVYRQPDLEPVGAAGTDRRRAGAGHHPLPAWAGVDRRRYPRKRARPGGTVGLGLTPG